MVYFNLMAGMLSHAFMTPVDEPNQVSKLNDFEVFSIHINRPFEPSGLTFKGDQLLTVCDDSNQIYALQTNQSNVVSAHPVETIDRSQLSVAALDLEGITVVEDEVFVVSEVHHKAIRIQGDQSTWVPENGGVYDAAYAAGLFQIYNAGMEAIVYLGEQTFLMSVEREPRGLIEVTYDENYSQIISQTNQVFDDSKYPVESSRKPDLTGLYYFDGMLYALHRNAYIINELIKDEHGVYHEGRAWSYEHIVKDPEYAYQDMMFGHAEGLAVDQDYFYLVIDNNNDPKLKNPNDIRPLLIKAKRQ